MKKILSFLFLGTNLVALAQLQVSVLEITTNDLVYDAVTNKIFASIPSSNGSNGNSLGIIDPNTNLLVGTVFIGSEPSVLAISDNGQYIYSGFNGTSTVRRFDVATRTAGIQFTLGTDNSTGSYYAEDIEVMPGQPTTIAVSRRNIGYSPRHEGVAIYDDNIMRPITTQDHTGSNKIEFTGQNSLIGYNNESTEYGIRRLAVNSGGVSNVSVTQSALNGFSLNFIYRNNYMYATNGSVIDISATPFVSGQFSNVNGPVAYDTFSNRVCFASSDFSGNIVFQRFNPNTFLLQDMLPISQAFGSAKSIIACGSGCYAFNTTDNKVIIIKDPSLLAVADVDKHNKLNVFPNPATDNVTIESDLDINSIEISDVNGRLIYNTGLNGNSINLSGLQNGLYLIRITAADGSTFTKKIVKK